MKRTGVFIPIEIWNLSELHPNERVLLAEVASFEEKGKQCFASNEHFANMLQVSIDTARGYISKLVNAGFLVRDGDRYNRRLRRITQTSAQISPHTITDTKTITKTNTKRDKTPKVVLPFQSDNFAAAWKEWIEYKKAAHRFTYKTPKSEQRALITLADAYKEEQDAIERIHQGITNGWKGLVFDSPKNRRTHAPRARNIETSDNRKKLEELARTGRIDSNRGAML